MKGYDNIHLGSLIVRDNGKVFIWRVLELYVIEYKLYDSFVDLSKGNKKKSE